MGLIWKHVIFCFLVSTSSKIEHQNESSTKYDVCVDVERKIWKVVSDWATFNLYTTHNHIVTNKQLHILHTYYHFKCHFHGNIFLYKKTKRSMSREKNANLWKENLQLYKQTKKKVTLNWIAILKVTSFPMGKTVKLEHTKSVLKWVQNGFIICLERSYAKKL